MTDPIDRQDWGPGGENRSVVPAEPTVFVPTERHADWGDGQRTSLIEVPESRPDFRDTTEDLDPALLERWAKEGGVDRNIAQAQAAVTDILSRADDADTFRFKFENQLSASIQTKIYDRLRISPAKGRGLAAIADFEFAHRPGDQALEGMGRKLFGAR